MGEEGDQRKKGSVKEEETEYSQMYNCTAMQRKKSGARTSRKIAIK